MKNKEVAQLLNSIADVLEIIEEDFKPRAYRRAAQTVEGLAEDIATYDTVKKLQELPAIGEGIAEKMHEYLDTGKSSYYETLKKKVPINVDELLRIGGIGPKTVILLYKKLNIKTRKQLEAAAHAGKIQKIPGMGPKKEKEILESIRFAKTITSRMLLSTALMLAEKIRQALAKRKEVAQCLVAGSVRRKKETIGDIDILAVSSSPEQTMDFFCSMPDVKKKLVQGRTKSSVTISDGTQIDLRIVKKNQWGAALNYFTGSKAHNIALRQIAIKKKWKLSEYGLFDRSGRQIAGKTEQGLYKKFGLQYTEPELRENRGEIEAAKQHKLPKLVTLKDINIDLQMHTTWSDGVHSIEDMAKAGKKLGYKAVVITDHVGSLKIAGAMTTAEIKKQWKAIDIANNNIKGITILKGAEVNIMKDGSLDINEKLLPTFDIVLGALHSALGQPQAVMMKRLEKALANKYINILAHPSGRIINGRPGANFDYPGLFKLCKKTNTVLEINASPKRLDLQDIYVKAAIEAGCKLSIGTDAHTTDSLYSMQYGVAVARRGWAEKKYIVNTYTLQRLKNMFNV